MHELIPIHKSFPFSSCQDKFPLQANGPKPEAIVHEKLQLDLSTQWKKNPREFCPGKLIILSTSAEPVYPFSPDLHTAHTALQNNLTFKSKLLSFPLPLCIPSGWTADWPAALAIAVFSGAPQHLWSPLDFLHPGTVLNWRPEMSPSVEFVTHQWCFKAYRKGGGQWTGNI